jgi:transposase
MTDSDSKIRYVGLDVHKRMIQACVIDPAGRIVHREQIGLSRHTLELFATQVLRPGDHVALEATTNCFAVADALRPHVARVVVSNPMATKAIAQAKVKTDKVDALVLAQLLRCDYLPEVWQPDEATRRLRELTGRRSALVGHRTALRNRIHAALAMRLIVAPSQLFNAGGLTWLAKQELDPQARLLVDTDLRQMESLQREIDLLDGELARRGYESEDIRLLMTLPGIDVASAEAVLAAWGDYRRFPDGDHAASYLGIVSSTHQSADQCYHGPITKRGNSQARWMLIEAAQHLDKHPGPLGHFFRRLAKKKNRNVAVVAAARKLAVIAWRMLTAREPYRYAVPPSTESKLARLRVKATGQRRKTGPPPGVMGTAKLPGGSQTIHSLSEVCRREGLPSPQPLSAGEQRTVADANCEAFVQQIAETQVVPRSSASAERAKKSPAEPKATTRSGGAAAAKRPAPTRSKVPAGSRGSPGSPVSAKSRPGAKSNAKLKVPPHPAKASGQAPARAKR